jgi:predicted lipoprotein with Yx(FWY)xxD motif
MKKLALVIAVAALAASTTGIVSASAQRAHTATAAKAKLMLRTGKLGRYIVDGKGFTLYLFEKDKTTKSTCYSGCAHTWAPLLTSGRATAGPGVQSAKIGTTRRKNGSMQVTYGGHPLYHYDDDHKPGMTEGQGKLEFGAKWYVLAAGGKKIDPS